MPSIQEEIRSRRAVLVEVQRALHDVDTVLEATQRLVVRVRTRKQYLPDVADAERISGLMVDLGARVAAAGLVAVRMTDVFQF